MTLGHRFTFIALIVVAVALAGDVYGQIHGVGCLLEKVGR